MAAKRKREWTVYIIETENGFLYTGITKDLVRRFGEHLDSSRIGGTGAKFFRRSPPRAIRLSVDGFTQSMALRLEYAVKQLSRKVKDELIAAGEEILREESGEKDDSRKQRLSLRFPKEVRSLLRGISPGR